MNPPIIRARTAEETRSLGRAFGKVARPGDRLLLEGPFGAGKTTLVQGLAEGLGVIAPVASPSYVIETQYHALSGLTLYHVDLYRLDRIEPELLEGLEEHLFGEGVAAVEWPERLPDTLREGSVVLRFSIADDDQRLIEVDTDNERFLGALSHG